MHHATVLTEYGLDVRLPGGDWASALLHLERVPDDDAGDRAGS